MSASWPEADVGERLLPATSSHSQWRQAIALLLENGRATVAAAAPLQAWPIMTEIFPSEELLPFMHRFYAAQRVWDFDTMREMISSEPHRSSIGTDSAGWWNGRDAVDIWTLQGKEMGAMQVRSTAVATPCEAQASSVTAWPCNPYSIACSSVMAYPSFHARSKAVSLPKAARAEAIRRS